MIPFVFLAIAGVALLAAGIISKTKYRPAMMVSGAVILAAGVVMVIFTLCFDRTVGNNVHSPYETSGIESVTDGE
ncbi:MAG: hypothetical protein K6F65_08910 [Lachnospiraceae bacterium]|nr:hypothetical protein [Lachnospiraceae bacterium]